MLASVAFGFYVSNFSSYNKTYGSLAGVIVFLLWLWITNLALLFGAEIDAELERARQLQAGIEAEETVQLPPRDTRNSEKAEEKLERKIAEGRQLRLDAQQARDDGDGDRRRSGRRGRRARHRRGCRAPPAVSGRHRRARPASGPAVRRLRHATRRTGADALPRRSGTGSHGDLSSSGDSANDR